VKLETLAFALASFLLVPIAEGARDPVGNAHLAATTPTIIDAQVSLTVTGRPNGPFILVGDVVPGPRNTSHGTICVGLSSHSRIYVDSIRGTGPHLDAGGSFTFSGHIPNHPSLLGMRYYLQAFVADVAAPQHLAHSNGLTVLFSTHDTNLLAPGSMGEARALHTATLLDGDHLLVAGGGSGTLLTPLGTATAEIWNVHTKDFAPTGSLNGARAFHTATLLGDGRVLLAGGVDAAGAVLDTAEIYDPAMGTFSLLASHLSVARAGHSASLLADGRVLVAGGTSSFADLATAFSSISNTADVFDPATSTFSTAANTMTSRRLAHSATVLQNGDVLLASGFDGLTPFGTPDFTNTAEVFHAATSSFDRTSGGHSVGNVRTPRAAHSATLLPDGRVLLAGGASGLLVSATSAAEIFSPSTGAFATTGSLPDAKAGHSAVLLPSGEVLVSGGLNGSLASPTPVATCALFSGASFTAAGPLVTARGTHTGTLLPNGTVLLLGGADPNGAVATGEIYSR
jgi:galactose oxidase-like protein